MRMIEAVRRWVPALILIVVYLGIAVSPARAEEFPGRDKIIQPNLIGRLESGQKSVNVIVLLKGYQDLVGVNLHQGALTAAGVRAAIARGQEEVLAGVNYGALKVKHRFTNLAGFSASVTKDGLKQLAAHEGVAIIEEDAPITFDTRQGIPQMNPASYRDTYWGAFVSIAIVDTGVDYTHPMLGGGGFPNDKVIGGYDFGDLDSDPMDDSADPGHGTACAGIAAGSAVAVGDYIGGVAPMAKIYALKIAGASGALTGDAVAAWDWCVTHKNDNPIYPILVISNSWSAPSINSSSSCDSQSPTYAAAAANVVANGIALFCSSGNDGRCTGVNSPACLSDTISVGAVYDTSIGSSVGWCVRSDSCVGQFTSGCSTYYACWETTTAQDQVTCYSNSGANLDLLAPSNNATTPAPGGGYDDSFGGTSAACPYAAGAAAVIQSWAVQTTGSYLSVAELKSRMVKNGDLITDSKSGLSTPRVNIQAAIEESGGSGGGTTTTTALEVIFGLAQGQEAGFLVTVPSGATNLTARLTDVTGDPDLYTGDGFIPSTTNYTCRSINGTGQEDSCSHANPTPGDWFIVVRGYTAATLKLIVTYTTPSDGSSTARWGVVDYVCCTSGGVVGFWGQIGNDIKGSSLENCAASPSWEGYVQTTAGTKTLSYWTYVGCGDGPSGSMSVTLEAGKCYEFRLRYTDGQYWVQQLEVTGCGNPVASGTGAGAGEKLVVKEQPIPLALKPGGYLREKDER